jgi:hypothetical protein
MLKVFFIALIRFFYLSIAGKLVVLHFNQRESS